MTSTKKRVCTVKEDQSSWKGNWLLRNGNHCTVSNQPKGLNTLIVGYIHELDLMSVWLLNGNHYHRPDFDLMKRRNGLNEINKFNDEIRIVQSNHGTPTYRSGTNQENRRAEIKAA